MSELQKMLAEIQAKQEEVGKAYAELVRFKADLDEGFRKLRNLRLRVRKLAVEGQVDSKVVAMIEEAIRD